MPSSGPPRKSDLYGKLHKYSLLTIFGVSAVSFGLFLYNVYLFKKEGVPMLIEKYRTKAEEAMELKQKEAEYREMKRKEEEMKKQGH